MIKPALALVAAVAAFSQPAMAHDLTDADIALEVVYAATLAVDYAQTKYIAKSKGEFKELNPIIGNAAHPDKIAAYFVGAAIGHAAITYVLPPEYRSWWQGSTIALQVAVIGHNKKIGIGMSW